MADHPKSIIPLTSAPNEMVAGIIIAALEREGIKATMTGAAAADFRVGLPEEIDILVTAEDLPRAQQILDEAEYEFGEEADDLESDDDSEMDDADDDDSEIDDADDDDSES